MSITDSPLPVHTEFVAMTKVRVGSESLALLEQVCASGMLAQGPLVAEVETAFAAATGVGHCVALSNGTVALTAALMAAGVGPSATVVTTPFTFIATINAALGLGARLRFADIGDDYTIDPQALASELALAAAESDRVAVVPVHLYGLVADMPAVNRAAAAVGAVVVEDAAQAHGARLDGRAAGAWGLAGTFSLYGSKNVTAGEGGLVTTDDEDVAAALRVLRNQGMLGRYEYAGWGTNWRWTDLQAAVALPQVRDLDAINVRRRRNASRLTAGLADVAGLRLPVVGPGAEPVWHQYTVEVLPEAGRSRDALAEDLRVLGVGSGVYYPAALSDVPHVRDSPLVAPADVPVARRVAARVLSLPVGHHLDDGDIDRVVEAVRLALRGAS